MGMPLYSLRYTEPAIRTEPEPRVDICETWSAWNRFDPDSEEFFHDAQYEAFLTQEQLDRERAEVAISALTSVEEAISSASSDTSEDSGSDTGSPTATGSDDMPELIAHIYRDEGWGSERWARRTPTARSPRIYSPTPTTNSTLTIPSRVASAQSAATDQQGNPAFIPPAAFREATPDITEPIPFAIESSSPARPRPIDIVPIIVSQRTQPQSQSQPSSEQPQAVAERTAVPSPSAPRTASPTSVPTTIVNPPSTPPPQRVPVTYTPSPAPTVTPRYYTWGRYPITTTVRTPASPSIVRDGPFTNPRARMSFARIDASPARIRIPSHVL